MEVRGASDGIQLLVVDGPSLRTGIAYRRRAGRGQGAGALVVNKGDRSAMPNG